MRFEQNSFMDTDAFQYQFPFWRCQHQFPLWIRMLFMVDWFSRGLLLEFVLQGCCLTDSSTIEYTADFS